MSKYIVKEEGKPCRYPDYKVHPSWNNCEFDNWDDAVKYANHWLGVYGPRKWEPNVPIDISSCEAKVYMVIEKVD